MVLCSFEIAYPKKLDRIRYNDRNVASARPSYAWSLHLEVANVASTQLSAEAFAGLDYAEQLAEDAPIRSRMNLPRYAPEFAPLTIAELADQFGVSSSTIRRRIARARRELFGEISDAAIYKRLQRARGRPRRTCAEPGCAAALAAGAHGNRRYCERHGSPAERIRRHRQEQAAGNQA